MCSTRQLSMIGLLAAVAALATTWPSGGDEPKVSTIHIGLTDTFFRGIPEARGDKPAKQFQSLLQEQTGLKGDVATDIKPADLIQQLKDGKLQLAIFQGFEYAWARQKDRDLKPMMIAVNQKPQLHALIVVRNDNAAASITDLKGKTLAVPRRLHEPCQVFLDRRIAATGSKPKDFFGKILNPTTPEEVVDAVVNGQVDAALSDDVFLDWYKKEKEKRFGRLKIIEKSAAFPAPVVVYRAGGLDDATVARLRKGMLSAKDTPRGMELMKLCQVTSFEPVPEDYDKQLTEIAKAYPAPEK